MRRSCFVAAVLVPVLMLAAVTKPKRYKHPLGFSFELPAGWNVEDAAVGSTLLPPGVKVDPNREDNAEVYAVWSVEDDQSTEKDYIEGLRQGFRKSSIKIDREGDLEVFSSPGKPGVIYTFDFVHPKRNIACRIRVFSVTAKGKPILLVATGEREKLAQRDRLLREVARSFEW